MIELADLIERVKRRRSPSNEIDIEIDIALFEPDDQYKSVEANSANTKLVFTLFDGTIRTHWAEDHTLSTASRALAVSRLAALNPKGVSNNG